MEIEIKEEWKDVPGYEGHYQASTLGRIKSLKLEKEKILNSPLSNPYLIVNLCKEGKRKNFRVHQLIAMTFLNHKPNKHKLVVDHINSNKLDNRVENLRIVSNRENITKDISLKSGLPAGVSKKGNKFLSQIVINKKQIRLGIFNTLEEASEAYQNELQKVK